MICFVLLNYNAFDVTINCVQNIEKLSIKEKKIIIVDNDSQNDFQRLLAFFKNDEVIEVVETHSNGGFAKGNNIGYEFSRKYTPKFIVIMNNDMEILSNDFEDKLETAYKNTDFDVLGPDIYSVKYKYHQNPQRIDNYSLNELKKMRNEYFLKIYLRPVFWLKWKVLAKFINFGSNVQKNTIEPLPGKSYPLHGSFYVFSKRFIDNNEYPFYEGTFMYMESYILYYLLQKKNERIVYNPSIVVNHFEDISTDRAYNDGYKKAVFTNKCMYNSLNAFIGLMKHGE